MMVGFWRWIRQLWVIQEPVAFWVKASPEACVKAVEQAARPSVQRLHLREVFTNGRRYDLTTDRRGFTLNTSAITGWRARQRTTAACTLHVRLDSPTDDPDQTTLTLTPHLRLFAIVRSLWLPILMAYIIGSNPWSPVVITAILICMFALAWAGLRLSASVDAAEMTYFIQKAFEEYRHTQPATLPAPPDPSVIGGADFEAMWERFVRARREE